MIILIPIIILAYLLGSIPSAVWYGKKFHQIDVRQHGSKNAGATNTLRVLGNKAGFTVLFLDLLKGFAATSLGYILVQQGQIQPDQLFVYKMILGMIAVLGHVFPVFAGFKGGKGIATLLGMCIALDYQIALICVLFFIGIVWATKYISVGSMSSAVLSALLSFYFYEHNFTANAFFCSVAVLVIYTHRANIKRLMSGNENRFSFNRQNK
jgi:glycerol-3-phosphate acyltransferase PlsY